MKSQYSVPFDDKTFVLSMQPPMFNKVDVTQAVVDSFRFCLLPL